MKRRLAIAFLFFLVSLVGAVVAFVRSDMAAELLCDRLRVEMRKHLDRFELAYCEVDPFDMAITLVGVEGRTRDRAIAFEIERAVLELREVQPLGRRPALRALTLLRPQVEVDLRRQVSQGSGGSTCMPPDLPVVVERARIVDAGVSLHLDADSRVESDAFTATFTEVGGTQRLRLEPMELRLYDGGRVERFGVREAELHFDAETQQLQLVDLSVDAGDLSVASDLTLTDLCVGEVDGTVSLSGSLSRLTELLAPDSQISVEGRGALSAVIRGPLRAPEVDGSIEVAGARIDDFVLGDSRIDASVSPKGVRIRSFVSRAPGGRLSVSGQVDFGSRLPARFDIEGRGIRLERLIAALGLEGAWTGAEVDGGGHLEGTLRPVQLSGTGHAVVEHFTVVPRAYADGLPQPEEIYLGLPPTRVEGKVRVTKEAIEVDGATLRLPHSELKVDRAYFPLSTTGVIRGEGRFEDFELSDLGPLGGRTLQGRASGSFTMAGPYRDPQVSGRVEVRGFVYEGLKAGVAVGRLTYDDLTLTLEEGAGQRGHSRYLIDRFFVDWRREPTDFALEVHSDAMRAEELVESFRDFHPLAARFEGVEGPVRGTVRVRGPKASLFVETNLTGRDLHFQGQAVSRLRIKGRLADGRRMEVDEASATVGEGTLRVVGWAELEGRLALSVAARSLPTAALQPFSRLPLAGLLSGDAVIEGTWEAPAARGSANLVNGSWAGVALGPVRLALRLRDQRLGWQGKLLGDEATGEGWMELTAPHRFGLQVDFDEPRLHRWLALWPGAARRLNAWSARGAGSLRMEGVWGRPRTYQGVLHLHELLAAAGKTQLRAGTPLDLRIADGGLVAKGVVLRGPASELHLAGSRSVDGDLDLRITGTGDLRLLATLLPAVERSEGILDVEASIGGRLESPELVGSAEVRDGAIEVRALPFSLDALHGQLAFSQNRVIFQGVEGRVGHAGRMVLTGDLALERFLPKRFGLRAELDEVPVEPIDHLRAVLSGALFLDGVPGDLLLSGELAVSRARYDADLDLERVLPLLRSRALQPPPEREASLHLDVGIRAPETLRIDTPAVEAVLRADLRLTGTDIRPGLLGTVEATEGHATFRGNEYELTRAVVDFEDGYRIAPSFDVHAEADIRDYRVYVHIFGTPEEPEVHLSSEPELSETDLFTLITLGITRRDAEGIDERGSGLAGLDALLSMSGLDARVRRFIPENPILPEWRLTTGYSKTTGQVEPRVAFEWRFLDERLRLRHSQPIGVEGQRTQAEYRITDTVSAQAEWDTEDALTPFGNLGMDLKLRWDLE